MKCPLLGWTIGFLNAESGKPGRSCQGASLWLAYWTSGIQANVGVVDIENTIKVNHKIGLIISRACIRASKHART